MSIRANGHLVREGDWITFRSRGLYQKKKVLEIRPDDVLVVGDHDNDPETRTVQPDDVRDTL
jgi:hypothetical protein